MCLGWISFMESGIRIVCRRRKMGCRWNYWDSETLCRLKYFLSFFCMIMKNKITKKAWKIWLRVMTYEHPCTFQIYFSVRYVCWGLTASLFSFQSLSIYRVQLLYSDCLPFLFFSAICFFAILFSVFFLCPFFISRCSIFPSTFFFLSSTFL